MAHVCNGTTHAFAATPGASDNAGIYRVMGEEATADTIDAGCICDYDGKAKGSLPVDPALPSTLFSIEILPKNRYISAVRFQFYANKEGDTS